MTFGLDVISVHTALCKVIITNYIYNVFFLCSIINEILCYETELENNKL